MPCPAPQVFCILGLITLEWLFGVVGLLAIIPGGYQSFVLLQTWRGVRGYRAEEHYDQVVTEEPGRVGYDEDVLVHSAVPGYLAGGGVSEADVEGVGVELTAARPGGGAVLAPVPPVGEVGDDSDVEVDEDAAAAAAAADTGVPPPPTDTVV